VDREAGRTRKRRTRTKRRKRRMMMRKKRKRRKRKRERRVREGRGESLGEQRRVASWPVVSGLLGTEMVHGRA
jgi:hypothetical protein